ncbi:RHS repeat-associated core domain-containing protein [Frondihabitans sp. 4ASC-45]|uniref:RHS repeat domain-containing protein n=1 Tax=Frondihabitans sp. 4ASC-45 TaxID=3111636 RepID=UPI003C19EA56
MGAKVDVATGNLMVSTQALSVVGVGGSVPIGSTYNSRGWQSGTSNGGFATDWTWNVAGAGSLTAVSAGVTLTQSDGATWLFKPISGSATAYDSPDGLKQDLTRTSTGYDLKDRSSKQTTRFDADGNAVAIVDKNSNETTIAYTGNEPTKLVSNAGPVAARTVNLGTDSNGFSFSQTSGALSRTVKYGIASDKVTSFTDALNNTTAFGYTGSHLTTITSPTGAVTTFGYSGTTDKVSTVTQGNTTAGSPGDSTTRISYASSTETQVAGPNTTASTVASSPHTTYTINGTTNLVSKTVDPEDRVRSATYTQFSDVKTSTTGSSTGALTTSGEFGQNGGNSATKVTAPGGASTSAEYDSAGTSPYSPVSVTSNSNTSGSSSNATKYHYDGFGNMDSSSGTDSTGKDVVSKLTYNGDGTVSSAQAPGNDTNKTVYAYNDDHQLTSITPVTGAGLGTKNFTYDAFGRQATQSDGAGRTTSYTYDNNDRILTTSFSDGTSTVSKTYDKAGNTLTQAAATGTVTNTFDQMSRLLTTKNSAGGGTITYTYDKASNQRTSTTDFGTYTNTFDDSGVLVKTQYPTDKNGGTVDSTNYATDLQGRRTDTWLNGSSTYTNKVPAVAPSSWSAHYKTVYAANGRVAELIAETGGAQGEVKMDLVYCYNEASKKTASTCSIAPATETSQIQWIKNKVSLERTYYAYENDRIKSFVQTGGPDAGLNSHWEYEYDQRGNRTAANSTGNHPSTQALTYNAANQITSAGYTYDGAGNLTASPTQTFTYNGAEQMTSATNKSTGTKTTYTYVGSAQNQLLTETTAGGNTYRLTYGRADQNGEATVARYQVNAEQSEIYSDAVTGQASMLITSTGTVSMYVYDGGGNPTWLLTDFGTNAWNTSYDPYGTQYLNSGGTGVGYTENPYAFKGGLQDRASGLVKFGIRWYNPITGTWTQQDTLDAPLDPKNANRYQFAGDDPINGSDPSGLCSVLDTLGYIGGFSLLGGIGFGLAGGLFGLAAGAATAGPTAGLSIPAGIAGGYAIGTAFGQVAGAGVGYAYSLRHC